MKSLLLCALLVLSSFGVYADTVTVFGTVGAMDLKPYPLDVRQFSIGSKTKMTDETVLRCCEALDNSSLVIFGLAFNGWEKLFANKAIANSFTEFMRRGGVAYCGTQTYDSLKYMTTPVCNYFSSIKLSPWNRKNYIALAKGESGTKCTFSKDYADFCAGGSNFLAVKKFQTNDKLWKPLLLTVKGSAVAVIQENICGKGTVIYSYDLKIFRETSHKMLEALLKKAFGKNMKKQSLKERNRSRKAGTEKIASDKTDGKFLMEQIPLFTRMEISTPPGAKAAEKLPEIVVTAGRNDKESVCIALYNQTQDTQIFRWEESDFIDGSKIPASDIFTVKEAVPWLDRLGRTVLEPLVKLNEANIITVPSGETRLLWIDVKSDLPAGKYTWKNSLVSAVNKDKSRPVVITLDLQNWRMPDDLDVIVRATGPYNYSWAKNTFKKYWALCGEYHINWIVLNDRPAAKHFKKNSSGKIEVVDDMADTLQEELELFSVKEFKNTKLYPMYGFGCISQFDRVMKKLGSNVRFGSEAGQKLFREWLTKYLAALNKAGINPENMIWNLMDEPRTKDIPDCVEFIKTANEFKLKTFCNFATWSSTDDVRRILDAGITLISPWEPRLLSRSAAAEELALCQRSGKLFVPYLCANSGNTQDYLPYYRFRGMRGFLMKAHGMSVWAMNAWRGNDWHSADDKTVGGVFLVHHGDNGPIPTIRLEAYREAVEDLYLLRTAGARKDEALLKLSSPKVLDEVMTKNDPAALMLWKEKLNRAMNKTIVK